DQLAPGSVAGPNHLDTVAAAPQGRRLLVEAQAGLLFLRPMARDAPRLEDRLDLLGVVDGPDRGRWPLRHGLLGRGRVSRADPGKAQSQGRGQPARDPRDSHDSDSSPFAGRIGPAGRRLERDVRSGRVSRPEASVNSESVCVVLTEPVSLLQEGGSWALDL